MATIFRPPVLVTVYKLPKAQPEYTVNLRTLYAPNPDRPFSQLDWPLAARPKPPQDAAAPANVSPLLRPNPSRPFSQAIWDSARTGWPKATGDAVSGDAPRFTPNPAAPFTQSEWRSTARVQLSLKSEPYWGAFPLYSPNPSTPFEQQLWDSAAKTPPKAVGEAVAGNSALLVPNPARPFFPTDWSRTPVVYKAKVDDFANLVPVQTVVVTIAPFSQGDWPNTAKGPSSTASDVYAGPATLLAPNPSQPFSEGLRDSATKGNPKAADEPAGSNVPFLFQSLATQPFSQSDWPNPVVGFATKNGTWINLGLTDGGTPVIAVPATNWDTSDPIFYDWWRKRANKRPTPSRIKPVTPAAVAKAEKKAPSRELITALAGVETFTDLKELKPLDPAYVGKLVAEFERLQKQQAEQAEEDDIEALLMVMLS